MRASRTTLLWAMGILAAIGCGSGSGANSGGGTGPGSSQNGSYQKPPTTYDKPPAAPQPGSSYEKPPSTYEPAPGSGPSGGNAVCQELCGSTQILQCIADGVGEAGIGNVPIQVDPSECIQGCTTALDNAPCGAELAAMADCLFSAIDITCELFDKLQNGDVSGLDPQQIQACEQAAQAFAACEQSTGGGTGGSNGTGGGNGTPGAGRGNGNGAGGRGVVGPPVTAGRGGSAGRSNAGAAGL